MTSSARPERAAAAMPGGGCGRTGMPASPDRLVCLCCQGLLRRSQSLAPLGQVRIQLQGFPDGGDRRLVKTPPELDESQPEARQSTDLCCRVPLLGDGTQVALRPLRIAHQQGQRSELETLAWILGRRLVEQSTQLLGGFLLAARQQQRLGQ